MPDRPCVAGVPNIVSKPGMADRKREEFGYRDTPHLYTYFTYIHIYIFYIVYYERGTGVNQACFGEYIQKQIPSIYIYNNHIKNKVIIGASFQTCALVMGPVYLSLAP